MLDNVLEAADPYFRRYEADSGDQVKEKSYGNEIPVARDVQTGEVITIPYSAKTRVLTAAKSGQKKTILGKCYISRIVDMGGFVFCGSDIKNDFQSFNYEHGPSQSLQDVTEGLLLGEKKKLDRLKEEGIMSSHFNRILGIPYFLKKSYDSNPSNIGTLFSIGFNDIKEQDLKYIFGYSSWSDAQQDIFDDILLDADDSSLSWGFLERRLDQEGRSGEKIWTRLRKYKEKGIIGSRGSSLNSFLDFSRANLISLGLKGIDDYGLGSKKNIRFYAAIALRRVIEKRQNGDFGLPFVMFYDEVHELTPASEDSPVTEELALAFSRRGRQAGLVTWLSTQEPHKIPSENDKSKHQFVSMTSHAFVGRGLTWPGYRTIFQAFNFYDSNNTQPLRDLKNSLGDGQFLYCDESMESVYDVRVVEPLSPLVSHPEGHK